MEEKGSSEILPSSSWKGNRSNGAVAGFLAEFPTHPLAYLHHRLASPKPGVSPLPSCWSLDETNLLNHHIHLK